VRCGGGSGRRDFARCGPRRWPTGKVSLYNRRLARGHAELVRAWRIDADPTIGTNLFETMQANGP